MLSSRSFLKKELPILLSSNVKVSFFRKKVLISNMHCIAHEVIFFKGNLLIVGTVAVRRLSKQEKSIILFYDNLAEEFLLNTLNDSIYHVKAVKSSKGLLYEGPFGSFIPIEEELL